ncbi:Transcription initiation factor TFIID subunit 12 [Vermiconidia calcicola]|uniref:Transcription initiation factor TFIID subunit 12 n=1 Tax=Vermiconidia calcicola TaxID=1690605 RepID=A0ACC3NNX1_9PEZI|nr:Transcription initiation factor TFIID subunit 12 [Vermiconidia calcicola]
MAQPQNQGQQSAPPLIRAHQIDALPLFTAEQKQHYKRGLTELWNVLDNSPQGSPAYLQAEEKIRNASMKIMQQISKGGNRPTSGGGPPQRPEQRGGGQGGMPQSVGMAQQGSQQGGQPQQVQQQPQQPQMSNATKQELSNMKISIPPHVVQQGQQAQIAYRQQWYRKGGQLLTRKELAKQRGVALQQQRSAGQGNAQQIDAEMEKCRSEMYAAHAEWEGMKTKNSSMDPMHAQGIQRQHSAQGQNQQQQMSGGQHQQQHHQQQNQAAMQGMHNAQQQQGDVKMQDTRGTSHSPQQPQGGFQQQQQAPTSQNQVAPSPAQQQQNMTQPPNSAHSQQTPQSATQQGFPQQNNMQQQQPNQQRPPMTGHQMSQAHQNMAQAQQQQQQQLNTPTSGVPQSATQQHPPQQAQQAQQQQQPQRPQPLSHQAAISQAAESYSRQQQQPNQQQPPQQNAQIPQVPNGLPLVPPPSATQQTPNSAYPALQQQSQSASASTKFPIPKQLNLDPRTQVPVQGPASRPTFSNAGMMSQPGLQRPAQFTLEGEGDRVLSKRKLDELVRQVTGTASSSSTDQGVLSADVEEAVLTLADDFVDNVITAACRLAKLRSSQTLDIVLERNYGIRIPGYGLDDVRTVRKFQPAPGWQTKMQAVQAGKVMGGVGKGDA